MEAAWVSGGLILESDEATVTNRVRGTEVWSHGETDEDIYQGDVHEIDVHESSTQLHGTEPSTLFDPGYGRGVPFWALYVSG